MTNTSIYVKSLVTINNQPVVMVEYGEIELNLTISQARKRGRTLIRAASISECEANILQVLSPQPSKGFAKASTKDQKMYAFSLERLDRFMPGL